MLAAEARRRERRAERELEQLLHRQLVDMGVTLVVVRQDPGGFLAYPGKPRVTEVDRHSFGGLVDPWQRRIVGPSRRPIVWYVSEAQAAILLHRGQPHKMLLYGAAGAGKTRLAGMWIALESIELCRRGLCVHERRAIGATAPTEKRLGLVVEALGEVCRPDWFRHRKRDGVLRFATGADVQLVATTEASGATGSPVQGWNWSAHVGDEAQDQTHAWPHILARGRSAPDGIYRQMLTATAKDSAAWRDFRDSLPDELWGVRKLEGPSNVFVHPSFWEQQKLQLSPRRYRQLVLAEDVGPERAMFPGWRRDRNLRPLPQLGGTNYTPEVLAGHGSNFTMLVGHDPGTLRQVSVLLQAFKRRGEAEPIWFVVGELATDHATTEAHAEELLQLLRGHGLHFSPDAPRALIRTDPWTQRDSGTHRGVHVQFRNAGLHCLSASYVAQRGGKVRQGHMHLGASVEVLNRLLCSAAGTTRLYVATNENGEPLAPQTAKALELAEWKPDGYRENVRKDDKATDWSDYHSALRYALWAYERVRPSAMPAQMGAMR